MAVFIRPLQVGKIDIFTFTLSEKYLASETLSSFSVTSNNANLTVSGVTNVGAVISVICTGVSEGSSELEFTWATPTKSGCESNTVIIVGC
jgi:hypothetical protein